MVLDEQQTLLRDTAREFCRRQAPISQLRRLRDAGSASGFDRPTWRAMVDLGWAAIPFPEAFGGLDFGYKGLGVVTEETGRTLVASPLLASVWLGGAAIALAGSDAQKAALLPQVAAGRQLLTLALDESHRHDPSAISTTLARASGGYRLNGRKVFVLDGHVADTLLVVARLESGEIALALAPREASGVAVTRTRMVDARNAAVIEFSNVSVTDADRLGEPGAWADAAVLEQVLDVARIGISAEMLGGLDACFEQTLAYLRDRRQFGVPIGAFQALKHRAAHMFCEIELARSCVLEALTALDEQRDSLPIAKLASLAKAKAGEAYSLVSRESIQMHGGIGMTDEFDIGFYIKRAAVSEQCLGDADYHRNRYADLHGY